MKYFSKYSLMLVLLQGLWLGAIPLNTQAGILNMGDAINKAGRQRMLTQRMLKSYSMLGQKIKPAEAQKELNEAVKLFEQQLTELKQFRVNNEVTEALTEVEQLWKPYQSMIASPPSVDKVAKLRKQGEKVLNAAHEVVLLLEDSSGTSSGHLVNLAGRQRMLSQRMASLYLLKSWGLKKARYNNDFSQAMREFKGGLAELIDADENTSDISRKLKKVKTQFSMFEYSVKTDSGEFIPQTISNAAGKILKLMSDITNKYAELPDVH